VTGRRYGRSAELLAAVALMLRGYRIVGRNVRVAGREVDLLARRGDTLVVCEVKARRSGQHGSPTEAVGRQQQRRLRDAGAVLLARDPTLRTVRFDVVAVSGWSVRHLPAAF
jgi:putative endonuclease